jgi:hypothetical protein
MLSNMKMKLEHSYIEEISEFLLPQYLPVQITKDKHTIFLKKLFKLFLPTPPNPPKPFLLHPPSLFILFY